MCYKSYPSRRGEARETNVLHACPDPVLWPRILYYYVVIKIILAMALCARNAHIIVMTSPLELINLVNPRILLRTYADVTYAADRSIIDWVISRCNSAIARCHQLSRDVCKSSRDVSQLMRDVSLIARCITVIARCVTVIARCITVVARCVSFSVMRVTHRAM